MVTEFEYVTHYKEGGEGTLLSIGTKSWLKQEHDTGGTMLSDS